MDNYTDINYNKNKIKRVAFEPLSIPPVDPVVGLTYFDTVKHSLRTWDGETWISSADLPIAGVGADGALGGIRVGDRLSIDDSNGLLSADIQSDNNFTDELKNRVLNIDTYIQNHNTNPNAHQSIRTSISNEIRDRQSADNLITTNLDLEIQRAMSVESALQVSKEDVRNKTTILSSSSTNTQYPSAATVYNEFQKVLYKNPAITASNEYRVVKYDANGLVTAGRKIINDDISAGIDATKIANGSVSNTEFQYLDGVTSKIQTQLNTLSNNKANKVNGQDLSDVKTELDNKITATNNIIGNKTYSGTIVQRTIDLSEVPTVLQANSSRFVVSHINVTNGGTGYEVNQTFNVGRGSTIPVVIAAVSSSGAIVELSWNRSTELITDIKGDDLSPTQYVGSGTGAKLQVLTSYAQGDNVTYGSLIHVPDEDPLVQYSRLQSYVKSEIASQHQKQVLGYICSRDPSLVSSSIVVGQLWYQSGTTGVPDTNFPWRVKEWDGKTWSSAKDYTPMFNDIWSNKNVTDPLAANGYFWFDEWKAYSLSFDPSIFVHTTNNETINGIKTFNSTIRGNIETADALKTARMIELTGAVVGSTSFKGNANVQISTQIAPNSVTGTTLQDGTVGIGKLADQKITAITNYTSLPTNYAVNNSKTAQAWLNDFASRLNYLVNNKNTIFVQTSQPTPNRTGDLWITVST